MRRLIHRGIVVLALALAFACSREEEISPSTPIIPDGTPVTLNISFGDSELMNLDVGTKAEASEADEARVHDIYVFIFNGDGDKIYGRFFSYEHLTATLAALDANTNEGWFVENKTITGVTPAVSTTKGAVKVSTESCSDATLVLLANIDNSISTFNDEEDGIAYLNGIRTLEELRGTKVKLEQDIVNRKDLFLKLGTLEHVNTANMTWGNTTDGYDANYTVVLNSVDAKVKFLVKCNETNISAAKAVYWKVCNAPDRCYLFSDYNDGAAPDDVIYFDTEDMYFEGTETVDGDEWYVFSFYMMESRFAAKQAASAYYDREKQVKTDTGESGYHGGGNFVENGEWVYADPDAAYVQFDLILTLTPAGIFNATEDSVNNALTSDAIFTVHLGDFSNVGIDDYNTLRSHFYTYKITVNNSGSIYAEVENDTENQAGQEGFLILTDDEIVNADSHYEYHTISFNYDPTITSSMFSWYVKTPFSEGQPTKYTDPDDAEAVLYDATGLDYLWVKFQVNTKTDDVYDDERRAYPGESAYDSSWKPSSGTDAPTLMDISQLIEFIFDQNRKKLNGETNIFDSNNQIKVTAFIDEYYYDKHPLTGELSEDLWRSFVNAKPREMHILSNARASRDRKSDVINSSHSIVQESIQTIYNIYAPGLRNLWGTEHVDEIKEKVPDGYLYWPDPAPYDSRSGGNQHNGRLNSAYIWNVNNSNNNDDKNPTEVYWSTYLNYAVNNATPELQESYKSMAFSCMTRNRDNNGNKIIDKDEVRWYLAASNQLLGMWVGNESLSLTTRLYQPSSGQWRSHIISSNGNLVFWAEEGAAFSTYDHEDDAGTDYNTWTSMTEAAKGESVRCLRNIGTFDDGGVLTDITFAPYSQTVEDYYSFTANADGTYSFQFDNLDSKSIREYSAGELPYHEQKSLTNRVYNKMTVQSSSSSIAVDQKTYNGFHNEIDVLGYNPYCPEGYRFPNLNEAVIMDLCLSDTYFSGCEFAPIRTYYDRGYYGSLKAADNSQGWFCECFKVGWAFNNSGHVSCVEAQGKSPYNGNYYNKRIKGSRCVKDDNMTGYINGEVTLAKQYLYPDEENVLTLNFFSTASALSAASIKLCYTAHSGNYREIDIPVEKVPSGIQYRQSQSVNIPSLSSMGLSNSDLPVTMSLQTTVRNVMGISKTVEVPVQLIHPLSGSIDFPNESDPAKGVPVRVNVKMDSQAKTITSCKLYWQCNDGEWNAFDVAVDSNDKYVSKDQYMYDIIGSLDFISKDAAYQKVDGTETTENDKKYYNFYASITSSDNYTYTSPTRSMEIIRFNYDPNPRSLWENDKKVSNIKNLWRNHMAEIRFSEGDYIETLMNLENCVYVYIDGNKNNDLGIDNILSVRPSNNLNEPGGAFMMYYPSLETLAADSTSPRRLLVHANGWTNTMYPLSNISSLHIVIDQKGMSLNDTYYSDNAWTNVMNNLISNNTNLYIGSTEGAHHSRAIYNYVRVIRNREMQ